MLFKHLAPWDWRPFVAVSILVDHQNKTSCIRYTHYPYTWWSCNGTEAKVNSDTTLIHKWLGSIERWLLIDDDEPFLVLSNGAALYASAERSALHKHHFTSKHFCNKILPRSRSSTVGDDFDAFFVCAQMKAVAEQPPHVNLKTQTTLYATTETF